MTTTSNTVATSTPIGPNQSLARIPTNVADTSWQINTRSNTGLRKRSGLSTRRTSGRAPRRWSSSKALALALVVRTRLVSASASIPDTASSTAIATIKSQSMGRKPVAPNVRLTPRSLPRRLSSLVRGSEPTGRARAAP